MLCGRVAVIFVFTLADETFACAVFALGCFVREVCALLIFGVWIIIRLFCAPLLFEGCSTGAWLTVGAGDTVGVDERRGASHCALKIKANKANKPTPKNKAMNDASCQFLARGAPTLALVRGAAKISVSTGAFVRDDKVCEKTGGGDIGSASVC